MGEAIGQGLPFAAGLAVSPFPLVAIVVILGSPRGRSNGILFALAAVAGIAAIGTIVLMLSGDNAADADGDPATWMSILRLVLGLLLLAYAAKGFLGFRAADAEPEPPGWMRALAGVTPARAAGVGVLVCALNPKALALTIAAAAAVAQQELPAGQAAASLAVLVAIGTLGVTAPLAAALALGERSDRSLTAVKEWMIRYNGVIMAVLALVFGASLLGDALAGFAS